MTEQSIRDTTHGGFPEEESWMVVEPEPTEEDGEETALEDLIEEMVEPEEAAREAKEAIPPSFLPQRMTGKEFTCSSCHLIMARSCLADVERLLCHDCVIEAGRVSVCCRNLPTESLPASPNPSITREPYRNHHSVVSGRDGRAPGGHKVPSATGQAAVRASDAHG